MLHSFPVFILMFIWGLPWSGFHQSVSPLILPYAEPTLKIPQTTWNCINYTLLQWSFLNCLLLFPPSKFTDKKQLPDESYSIFSKSKSLLRLSLDTVDHVIFCINCLFFSQRYFASCKYGSYLTHHSFLFLLNLQHSTHKKFSKYLLNEWIPSFLVSPAVASTALEQCRDSEYILIN